MDLRHVRMFLTVYRHGNISSAADDLGMNQPALSKMLRRLEGELQVDLFDRSSRGVEPNVYGRALAHFAQAIDSNFRSAIRQIDAIRDAQVGQVIVGAGGTWRDSVVPQAVAAFQNGRPGARVRIVSDSVEVLFGGLVRGELDAVLGPIDVARELSDSVRVEPLLHTRLVVIGGQQHPALGQGNLSLRDLARLRWVLPTGAFVRQRFDAMFQRRNVTPPIPVVEVEDARCLFNLVATTELVTFVSEARMRSRPEGPFAILPTSHAGEESRSGIATRRTGTTTPLCEAFLGYVRDAIPKRHLIAA